MHVVEKRNRADSFLSFLRCETGEAAREIKETNKKFPLSNLCSNSQTMSKVCKNCVGLLKLTSVTHSKSCRNAKYCLRPGRQKG